VSKVCLLIYPCDLFHHRTAQLSSLTNWKDIVSDACSRISVCVSFCRVDRAASKATVSRHPFETF
jgi:hypothetical protein